MKLTALTIVSWKLRLADDTIQSNNDNIDKGCSMNWTADDNDKQD